jgi:ELWxxDGT repeat protein
MGQPSTNGGNGRKLWKSDGTAAGTALVQDIYPGSLSSNPTGFVAMGTTLFFTATDATHSSRSWRRLGDLWLASTASKLSVTFCE